MNGILHRTAITAAVLMALWLCPRPCWAEPFQVNWDNFLPTPSASEVFLLLGRCAVVGLGVANGGLIAARAGDMSRGRFSRDMFRASLVLGGLGAVGGGLLMIPDDHWRTIGGLTLGLSLANLALSLYDYGRERASRKRVWLAPMTAGNRSVSGLAVAGVF